MSDIVPAVVSTSPRFILDKVNWEKIGKGALINLGGALLAYLSIVLIPDLRNAVADCQANVNIPCDINPALIWLVPAAATVVNTLKEWLTDYAGRAAQARVNLSR